MLAQDGDMVNKACYALTRMAVWVPELVLPMLHERFQARSLHLLAVSIRLMLASLPDHPALFGCQFHSEQPSEAAGVEACCTLITIIVKAN